MCSAPCGGQPAWPRCPAATTPWRRSPAPPRRTPLSTGYETKPAAQDRIDAAARAAGRDPAGIRRVIQLVGTVTDAPYATSRPHSGPGGQPIRTTPDVWAKIITELATEQRFDTVNLISEQETAEQLRLFGTEVIPVARAAK